MKKYLEMLAQEYEFIDNYVKKTKESSDFVKSKFTEKGFVPKVALTLGSSFNTLKDKIDAIDVIPYHEIPYMSKTSVPGHKGELLVAKIEKVPVIVFVGRNHYYEMAHLPSGMLRNVLPVHIAANLGAELYFATNAAGGLNRDYSVGDLMVIESHVSTLPNPLLGKFYDFGGTEMFPALSDIYDKGLSDLLEKAGKKAGAAMQRGVLWAHPGKSFETTAECRAFRDAYKCDAVGMSTAPEIIVATSRKMDTIAMSLISNVIDEDGTNATSHEEVLAALSDKKLKKALFNTIKGFFKLYNGK